MNEVSPVFIFSPCVSFGAGSLHKPPTLDLWFSGATSDAFQLQPEYDSPFLITIYMPTDEIAIIV